MNKIVEQDELFAKVAKMACPLNCDASCPNFKRCIAPYEQKDPIEIVIESFKQLHNLY